jgi:peptidoglycan/LPS O-acetylase OafA/YrhL
MWLDGVKGIACMLVFFHHFFLAFYPATYFGEKCTTHLYGFDVKLAQSPLSVVINGNFMVALFCVISGTVISMQVMSLAKNKEKLSDIVFKRYFRLMFPLLPVGIVVFFMLKFGLFTNLEAATYTQSSWLATYYSQPISFLRALKSIFIQIWFYGDDCLSTAFWMLSQLFYGCFLSIILSIISWKANKHTWIIYLAVFSFFIGKQDFMIAFVLGTLLAWLYNNRGHGNRIFLGWLCFGVGIFLGGYPSGITPINIYHFFSFLPYLIWHVVGAALTVYAVFNLNLLQRFLSLSLFRMLGKISYAVYIIHIPVLFSLSTEVFLISYKQGLAYWQSVVISLIVSTIILVVLSLFYNKYVEALCEILQNKISRFFISDNSN